MHEEEEEESIMHYEQPTLLSDKRLFYFLGIDLVFSNMREQENEGAGKVFSGNMTI